MTAEDKYKTLRKIFWDTNITGEELYLIVTGGKKHAAITREKVFIRMLERLSWYKILTVIAVNDIKKMLSKELISSLRNDELREKYEFIRKVLHGETLSFTGWGDEYYQKVKHTLFSNRWYSTGQALL